jgi:hypothetical protein
MSTVACQLIDNTMPAIEEMPSLLQYENYRLTLYIDFTRTGIGDYHHTLGPPYGFENRL